MGGRRAKERGRANGPLMVSLNCWLIDTKVAKVDFKVEYILRVREKVDCKVGYILRVRELNYWPAR